MNWKITLFAWLLFFAGLGVELVVDYTLRMRDGNPRSGGLAPSIYYGTQVVLFLCAFFLLLRGTLSLEKRYNRVLVLAVQVAIGSILYFWALFSYVIGAGIDSL